MKFTHQYVRAAIGLALGAITLAGQAADKTPAPAMSADAEISVPATRYQSLLSYTPATASNRSPDQNWKTLNDQVGAYDSMSLTAQVAAAADNAPDQHKDDTVQTGSAAPAAHQPDGGTRKDQK